MTAKRQKSEIVSVRFTPAEDEAVREAAKARGWSVSQLLREAAIKAAGPRCASCGAQDDDLAWVVTTGQERLTIHFGAAPFSTTGLSRWAGWRCRPCCMRDYGVFVVPQPRQIPA